MPRQSKYWEPPYVEVPVNQLQRIVKEVVADVIASIPPGGGPTVTAAAQIVLLLNVIKDSIMSLSAQVQSLVDQVAASKSIEASSAASLAQLVTQSADLKDQLAKAVVAAGAAGMSAEDTAAIVKAATDLHDSASALAAAAPQNTAPPAPADVIPPVVAAPAATPAA